MTPIFEHERPRCTEFLGNTFAVTPGGIVSNSARKQASTSNNPSTDDIPGIHFSAHRFKSSHMEAQTLLSESRTSSQNLRLPPTPRSMFLDKTNQAVFLYRGGSGCETLWKQIEHQHITLVEQSAENAPAELILNARAFRRPRSFLGAPVARSTSDETAVVGTSAPAPGGDSGGRAGGVDATGFEQDDGEVGGFLMKLSLPNSACCRELAQLLQSLSENA